MSIINDLNENKMPTFLDKTTPEYLAIYGRDPFTPEADIIDSADYNCGAICNELEYVKGFADYLTRSNTVDLFYSNYLDRVVDFFIGLKRTYLELDASLRNRFKALCIRQLNTSWATKWCVRDVFEYFFDPEIIYVIENYVLDNYIQDEGFEIGGYWNKYETGGSTVSFVSHDQFDRGKCAEISVDASGSECYLSQTMTAVPIGNYMFSFFSKDDRVQTTPFKVIIQRSIDSYYYNFTTFEWQAAETHLVVNRIPGTRYEITQAYIVNPIARDITIKFQNIGSTTTAYKYWIDRVEFGTQLLNPSIKVTLINIGASSGFMSAWEGTNDPIPGLDYNFASFLGQCYIEGFGGIGTLQYYQNLLGIIKVYGVQSMVEVIERDV